MRLWYLLPLLEFNHFQGRLQATFLVVSLSLTGGFSVCVCVCVSVCLLPTCPWHKNRKVEDRWRHLPGETLKASASNSHAEIIILWPPNSADHEQLGFGVAMRSSPTNLLLHNTFSLPARTRHPSLAWNKPPAETHESGLFVSLCGSCSGFLVRVIANQHSSSAGQSCHYPWDVADETQSDNAVGPVCRTIVKQHNHTAVTMLCSVCLCWVKSPTFPPPIYSPTDMLFSWGVHMSPV